MLFGACVCVCVPLTLSLCMYLFVHEIYFGLFRLHYVFFLLFFFILIGCDISYIKVRSFGWMSVYCVWHFEIFIILAGIMLTLRLIFNIWMVRTDAKVHFQIKGHNSMLKVPKKNPNIIFDQVIFFLKHHLCLASDLFLCWYIFCLLFFSLLLFLSPLSSKFAVCYSI